MRLADVVESRRDNIVTGMTILLLYIHNYYPLLPEALSPSTLLSFSLGFKHGTSKTFLEVK